MDDWEARVAEVWARADELDDSEVLAAIDGLVDELPNTDARAAFEAASVRDFLGLEPLAEPLYRRALDLGLDGDRRPRAVIQLASTLRNIGKLDESIDLLQKQIAENPTDAWAAPASAFLALALATRGDAVAATSVALIALAGYLPAYGNAVRAYATEL